MTETELAAIVGFVICEFEPEEDELCEVCNKGNLQLYYRRTCYEEDEGEYFCFDCIVKEHQHNIVEYRKLCSGGSHEVSPEALYNKRKDIMKDTEYKIMQSDLVKMKGTRPWKEKVKCFFGFHPKWSEWHSKTNPLYQKRFCLHCGKKEVR